MSAPAMKAFSPAPVTTTTPTASSRSSSPSAARTSSRTCCESALSLSGRLTVMMATRPSRSTRMVSGNCSSGMCVPLFVLPGRRALLQEGGDPLRHVGGGGELLQVDPLGLVEGAREGQLLAGAHGALGEPADRRAARQQRGGELLERRLEPGAGDAARQQTQPLGLGAVVAEAGLHDTVRVGEG